MSTILGEVTVQGVAEFSAVPMHQAKTMLAMAHLKAPLLERVDEAKRAPVRVSAVVDRSGSMNGEKLELVKQTLHFVINEMGPDDQLGLVTFDHKVKEVFPVLPMTAENKHMAAMKVLGIRSGGSTNLSDGLLLGLDQLVEAGKEHGGAKGSVTSTWLFTDGQANSGLTSTEDIVEAMGWYLKQERPPTVFTFGYGADHDESMMRAIAEAGHGMYYFLDNPESIPSAFAECLGGLLSVVGQEVQLKVEARSGVKVVRVLDAHLSAEMLETGAELRLKDLYSEEERDVVIEIEVGDSDAAGMQELVLLSVTYRDPLEGGVKLTTGVVTVDRVEGEVVEGDVLNDAVERQRTRIMVVEAVKKAKRHVDNSSFSSASSELRSCARKVKDAGCDDLFEDVTDCLAVVRDRNRAKGEMERTGQCHMWQRSCGMKRGRYTNKIQKEKVQRSAETPVAQRPADGVAHAVPSTAGPSAQSAPQARSGPGRHPRLQKCYDSDSGSDSASDSDSSSYSSSCS